MAATLLLRGIVKGGVVVPESGTTFPEGSEVQIRVLPIGKFATEEQAEFEAWDKLGDESWAMIDTWEKA